MRTISALALLTVLAVGCGEANVETAEQPAVETQPAVFNAEGNPTIEINVPGMDCPDCSANAQAMLAELQGVTDVQADPELKKVTIAQQEGEFDSEAARAALEDRFGEAEIVAGTEG